MNNINYTKEQLFELYGKAPEDIQSMIRDENLGPAIQVIGKDHGITPEQALDVEDIVLHTLLGIESHQDFTRRILEKLGISKDTARKIAEDVDENIFLPVKESLNKIHETKKSETTIKTPIVHPMRPSTQTVPEKALQVPKAPFERTHGAQVQPSTLPSKIVKKKPVPYEGRSAQTPPTAPPIPPTTHKPIIGAEKVGVGIPAMERPQELQRSEHMFEKKMREAVPPPQKDKPAEKLVDVPDYSEKADPYREPAE